MPFQPDIAERIAIDSVRFGFVEHPNAPGAPYGQEGRQATVFQLTAEQPGLSGQRQALKVFKPRFRVPALVSLSERLRAFADLPGLAVCRRAVLTPQRHGALLRRFPDLTYGLLMPWVDGPTWQEVLLEGRELSADTCLRLARGLLEALCTMEQRGIAHCDLSGANLLLPALAPVGAGGPPVALVDVEQLFGPDLYRPGALPGGSPGYAHRQAADGLWSSDADRFAGGVLLAEIVGWCDPRVRGAAWGESYFEPSELQAESARYRVLLGTLHEHWGDGIANLLERVWQADALAECPTFGEWLTLLPASDVPAGMTVPGWAPAAGAPYRAVAAVSEPMSAVDATIQTLLELAEQLQESGNNAGALRVFRRARAFAPPDGDTQHAIAQRMEMLADLSPAAVHGAPMVDLLPATVAPAAGAVAALDAARWRAPRATTPRELLVLAFAGLFAVLGLGTAVVVIALGADLGRLEAGLLRVAGPAGFWGAGAAGQAALVGGVEAWIFRRTLSGLRLALFLAFAVLGGLWGGLVGAYALLSLSLPGPAIGVVIGVVAGDIAGIGQCLCMRQSGARLGWYLWSVVTWPLIWGGAAFLSWNLTPAASVAFASTCITVATGLALALLLFWQPGIEF